jgi:hypothetical protein
MVRRIGSVFLMSRLRIFFKRNVARTDVYVCHKISYPFETMSKKNFTAIGHGGVATRFCKIYQVNNIQLRTSLTFFNIISMQSHSKAKTLYG